MLGMRLALADDSLLLIRFDPKMVANIMYQSLTD